MPAIIQIPGISGNTGAGIEKCKEIRGDGSWLRYSFAVMSDKKAGDWFR